MRLFLSNPFRLARLGLSSSALLLLLLFPRHNARASGNPLPLALSSEAAVLLLVPPTLLVGVLTALRAEGSDRTLAWSFSALPVALTLHGALSLALPEESGELERESAGAAMPQFSLAPMPSGFFLQASGDW